MWVVRRDAQKHRVDDDQQQEMLKMLPDLHEENNVDGRNTQSSSSSSFVMDEGYNEHFFSHFEDTGVNEFICPKCGRIYSDWESCQTEIERGTQTTL